MFFRKHCLTFFFPLVVTALTGSNIEKATSAITFLTTEL